MTDKELVINAILEDFKTLRKIAQDTNLPVSRVSDILTEIRTSKEAFLSSRPGASGGYRYDGDQEKPEYGQTKSWTTNWRNAMGIEPPESPVL